MDVLVTQDFLELSPICTGPWSYWRNVFESKLENKAYGVMVRCVVGSVNLPIRDPASQAPRDSDVNAGLSLRRLEGWGGADVFKV